MAASSRSTTSGSNDIRNIPKIVGAEIVIVQDAADRPARTKVVTVSKFSARELIELFGLSAEQIVVIPNGVSEEFSRRDDAGAFMALKQRIGLGSDRFLLFVGGADPEKPLSRARSGVSHTSASRRQNAHLGRVTHAFVWLLRGDG
jgi:glycosyltransferase involved in cell wall biosynthesis